MTHVLLTRDEAIELFTHSALPLADTWTGHPDQLTRILHGHTVTGMDPVTRERARHHRAITRLITGAGHHDIITDQTDGIIAWAFALT